MARRKNYTPMQVGLKYGFRSGLEESMAKQLDSLGIDYKYEDYHFPYTKPESKHKYTPDFFICGPDNVIKMIIETKGRFMPDDRKKLLLIKEQYPELDLRLIFSNSRAKIRKGSKTSYGDWCDKNGFLYADKVMPAEWVNEVKGI